MLQVQDAVKSSLEMLGTVFPPGDVKDPRLEEVALTDDEQYWLVTVSFSNPEYEKEFEDVAEENKTLASLLLSLQTPRRRVTKTIKVRANDGSLGRHKESMAILDFQTFVANASHRTAILDTNLLILQITARVDPRLLMSFKRVRSIFALEDVRLLNWVLSRFANVVTTSYVLTEASNLGNSLSGSDRAMWFAELARYGTLATEAHIPTSLLGSQPETIRFGFADSALRQLSKDFVVVTAEHRLSGYLEDRDAQVLNFNHLRPLWMIRA